MTPKSDVGVAGTILGLTLLACGGSEAGSARGEAVPEAGARARVPDDTVRVYLSEYMIEMPVILDGGENALSVSNRGFEDHNLRINIMESDSIVWKTEGNLTPGSVENATLDLAPGSYMVICDFAGHDARGMFVEIEVRGEAR